MFTQESLDSLRDDAPDQNPDSSPRTTCSHRSDRSPVLDRNSLVGLS